MMVLAPGLDLAALASRAPYWFSQWLLIMIPSALLLTTTPKSSILRIAWIPCCLYLIHRLLSQLLTCSAGFAVRNTIGGMFVVEAQHLLSIMFFVWPDAKELEEGGVYGPHDGLVARVFKTVGFFYNLRGIGTKWQITKVNPHPKNLRDPSGKISRTRFLMRQLALIAWQWLFLDLVYEGALQQTPEEKMTKLGTDLEFAYSGMSTEQWVHRFIVSFCSWLGPTRAFLDLTFRIASVVSVGLGMSEPEAWPPSFGTVADLYSVRSFWGNTWHQYLRRPLTIISNFTTRNLLGLAVPSILERYLNITIVFFLSGVAHAVAAWYDPAYPSTAYLPTIAFFIASAVGIMIEDGVQAAWRTVTRSGPRREDDAMPLWHKIVGLVWLAAWLTLTAPWMVYSPSRFDAKYSWFVPVRIVPVIGGPAAGGLFALGALVLVFGFKCRF